ncbi:MAG: hypothetical protein ABH854_03735 [Candidatus Diapherotrites archaeon]|nr:hypothetical protein [Candidatus Micrarchaeota archaeon]MBU1940098.1 hypothetical protein [Candidatus Micrarchaeota archaeon]
MLLLLIAGTAGAQSYNTLLKANTFSQNPATVYAGDTVNFNVQIESTSGNVPAKEVIATLSLNENYFESIHVEEGLGTIHPGSLKNAVFRFKVRENAYPGTYKFSVNLKYKNGNDAVEHSYDADLLVTECYSLDVGDVKLDTYAPHLNEMFRIMAKVTNNCSGEARNVSVNLRPQTNSTLDPFISLSDTIVDLGDIGPYESKPVSYSLKASDKGAPKTYVFEIDANCLDCSSSAKQSFSFDLFGRPDLIISGIDFSIENRGDDKRIMQADTLTLSVQLDNIGKETAKATRVALSPDAGIEGILESYVGNIDDDDSGSGLFTLVVSPTAELGERNVPILITYRDELNEEQKIQTSIDLYIHPRPAESPIGLLILIVIILVLLYFIIKMVFRQLAMRKA